MHVELISITNINWTTLLHLGETYLKKHLTAKADELHYKLNDPRTFTIALDEIGDYGNKWEHLSVGFFIACDQLTLGLLMVESKGGLVSEQVNGIHCSIITKTVCEWQTIVLTLCNHMDDRLRYVGNMVYDCFEKLKLDDRMWPQWTKKSHTNGLFYLEQK